MKKIALAIATALTASAAHSAVVISPMTLTTVENGAAVQYKIVLDSPPSAGETVTVTPASGDATEGSVSGPVQFTSANYLTPQYVSVTPGSIGDGNDGDVAYTITNTISSLGGTGAYTAGPAASINVTNANIDGLTAVIIVDPSSGFWITEGSSRVITFQTGPDLAPAGGNDVMISLINNTPGQVTLSTNLVILTAFNGYSETVTISAIDDAVVDGEQAFSITTAASISGDALFNNIGPLDISGFADDQYVVSVVPVPTLGEWARIGLVLMIMGVAGHALLRKQQG